MKRATSNQSDPLDWIAFQIKKLWREKKINTKINHHVIRFFTILPIHFLCSMFHCISFYTFYSRTITSSWFWNFSTVTTLDSRCYIHLLLLLFRFFFVAMKTMMERNINILTESKSMLSVPWLLTSQINKKMTILNCEGTQIMNVCVCLYDVSRECASMIWLRLPLALLLWLRLLIYKHQRDWLPASTIQIHIEFNCISVNFCFICKWNEMM